MKKCPFCAEDIQDAAIFCKHCRRDLPSVARTTSTRIVPGIVLDEDPGQAPETERPRVVTSPRASLFWKEAAHEPASKPPAQPAVVASSIRTLKTINTIAFSLLGFLFVVAVVAVVVSGPSLEDSAPTNRSTTSQETTSTPPQQRQPAGRQQQSVPPPVSVDADQLSAAYQQNEIAADQMYKGKQLLISGRVQSIGKDVIGTPYITLGNGQVPKVQAMFSKDQESMLAAIKTGEMVTVVCTGDGRLGWVFARQCMVAP